MDDTYLTISRISEGIYKEKMSKFLAFAIPVSSVEDVKKQLEKYQKEYYDARHVCWAYMLGPQRTDFRSNDNGEPSGTAGKPRTNQFGGTNRYSHCRRPILRWNKIRHERTNRRLSRSRLRSHCRKRNNRTASRRRGTFRIRIPSDERSYAYRQGRRTHHRISNIRYGLRDDSTHTPFADGQFKKTFIQSRRSSFYK